MKKIIELVKYQLHMYFKGSRFVMPFVAMAIFLGFMYSSVPNDILGCIIITYHLVFIIMVWIGLSVSSAESPVMEQIIVLRVQSNVHYYISKMLFLMILGILVSIICLFYPIAVNLVNHGALFDKPLTIFDVLNAFVILCGSSAAGCSLGSFFHPRVMKDRKLAIVLTVLAATITLAKTGIVNGVPFTKIFIWILPPLDAVAGIYGNAEFFQVGKSLLLFFLLFVYALIAFIIKSLICTKKKF